MKTKYFIFAASALVALASCSNEEYIGDNSVTSQEGDGAIQFTSTMPNATRADFYGATAADKLGGMFVVEGTKGSEQETSPSTNVVFDNYLVGYEYNSAGKTESNTKNWEYVGKQTGITGRMTPATWGVLHPVGTSAQVQSVKYWDYSVDQYDFIAWSTGTCLAVPTPAEPATPESGQVQVSRIATGATLKTNGFTLKAANAADLLNCYYTDIITVTKESDKYGQPVTLTFKNLAAKVRIALYETVPGYAVKDVKFYNADPNPTAPTDLGTGSTAEHAYLFTMGDDKLPQSGSVLVTYPRIGTANRGSAGPPAVAQAADYNKASVTVTPGTTVETKQEFGALDYNAGRVKEGLEPDGSYLGYTLPTATFAGAKGDDYYTGVIPNTNGKPLTLRVDYTLVSTDGSAETIVVKGAKAVIPSTYTVWQPNYAYTYIFKISDNSNGYTGTKDDPNGLFPITFDAVVASFTEANAEQKTITTVSTPSITTYQQGHDITKNEYNKNQTAGASSAVKDVYVQVMDNGTATPTLKADLNTAGKSLLFSVSKATASEAEVMDALQNRTNEYDDESPVGRNGITLTTSNKISNTETSIVNGVDDQPITGITAGKLAKIDIDGLSAGTYAYVYCTTIPTEDERIYNVVSDAEATAHPTNYYEVLLTASDGTANILASGTAAADHVYFYKNLDKDNKFVSYTFKQTKVGDSVVGLVDGGAIVPATKAETHHVDTDTNKYFYFDVYNQNDGEYAVKVIKVVDVAMP